jgi:hypothetical protein
VMRVIGTLTFFALCSGWAAAIVCSSSSCCQFIAILAVSVGRCALLLGAPAKILPPTPLIGPGCLTKPCQHEMVPNGVTLLRALVADSWFRGRRSITHASPRDGLANQLVIVADALGRRAHDARHVLPLRLLLPLFRGQKEEIHHQKAEASPPAAPVRWTTDDVREDGRPN